MAFPRFKGGIANGSGDGVGGDDHASSGSKGVGEQKKPPRKGKGKPPQNIKGLKGGGAKK